MVISSVLFVVGGKPPTLEDHLVCAAYNFVVSRAV